MVYYVKVWYIVVSYCLSTVLLALVCQSRLSDKTVALCHGGVQALAETDPEAAVQLQAINAQLKAVTQRIRNYDEEKVDELEEEQEAQSRGRTQLCFFIVLVAVGLVAIAVWALS